MTAVTVVIIVLASVTTTVVITPVASVTIAMDLMEVANFTTAATMPMVIAPTAIPEHRSAVEPAIVMRSANRDTFKLDRTIVDRIATIALVIVVVPVARSGRIISGTIVISGGAHAHADMHAR